MAAFVMGMATMVLAWGAAPASAKLKCVESKCTNPSVVQEVRAAVDEQCDCEGATSRKEWKKCWKPVVKSFKEDLGKTGFPKPCQKDVKRALTNATCGRPGFVLCRKVNGKGIESCKVTKEARCSDAYPTTSACGVITSCADACTPPVCSTTTTVPPTTTSTTVATTSTTIATTSTTIATTSTTIATTSTTIATTSTTIATTSTTMPTTSTTIATTTTTIATTTTTIGPFCGDGVVNQISEECDGSDLGGAECPGSAMGVFFPVCLGDCTLDFSPCDAGTTTTTIAPTSTTLATTTTTMATTTSSSTSTSSTTSTSTSTSSTTSTAPSIGAILSFITGPAGGVCGEMRQGGAAGTVLRTLTCGGLNVGGGCYQEGGSCGVNEGPTPSNATTNFNALCTGPTCDVSARTMAQTGSNNTCSDTGCQFGTYLSIANGGTSTCVLNTFASPGSGTLDLTTGAFDGSVPLTSAVTLTGNGAAPCPRCLVGGVAGQGTGVCSSVSANAGATCVGVNPSGDSYECVPSGVALTPFGVDLTPISTGTTFMDTTTNEDQTPLDMTLGAFCPGQDMMEPGSLGCFGSSKLAPVGPDPVCDYIEERGSDAVGIALDGGQVAGTLASVFCIPAAGNGLIDGAADLPGPGATSLPGTLELISVP